MSDLQLVPWHHTGLNINLPSPHATIYRFDVTLRGHLQQLYSQFFRLQSG